MSSGCAAIDTVRQTPARVEEFVKDPVRARNMGARIVEALVGGAAVIPCWLALGPLGLLCAPVAEFLVYEYGLEPAGVTGPYWERGPRLPVIGVDGSVAEPGEVYRHMTEPECAFYQATWHPDPSLPSGGWCASGPPSSGAQ